MSYSPRRLASSALALVALACSLTGRAAPGVTPAPSEVEGPVPSATSAPVPSEVEGPPPPADFEAVLNADVAAGTITKEEGIIRLLQAFLGDPQAGLPETYTQVPETEGNGVIELANDYLARGEDQAAKAEIQQLLETLIPSTEQLQAYSQPAGSSWRPPGVAAPMAQTDCATLWRNRFPTGGGRYICFEYITGEVAGVGSYSVYYPASWAPDDPGRARLEATALAAHDAMTAYRAFGDIGPVNIIFSVLPSPAGFLAEVYSRHPRGDEACPLLIFPRALAENDLDQFKQTVAHEIFHCYQVRNLNGQMLGTDRSVRKWWSEASAEYFSNVVYDKVNYEYRHQGEFDYSSPTTPLVQMDYGNAVLFQYLATRLGDAGVIRFLRSMPTSGDEAAQIAALADYSDMQTIFHDFARAYLEGRIDDRGGGAFPVNPGAGDELHFPEGSGGPLIADPFVVTRFHVTFDDDLLYTLTTETSGVEGMHALRLGFGEGAWGPVPGTLNTACPLPPSTLLLTNATPGGAYEVQTSATTEDSGECDRCLLGSWQMDLESYRAAFASLASTYISGGGTLDEVSGVVTALFLEDGHVYTTTEGFVAGGDFTLGDQPARVRLMMDGTVSSIYVVEREGRLTFLRPEEALTTSSQVTVSGVTVDVPGMELPGPGLVSGEYTCTPDTLHLTPLDVGVEHPGVDFKRVR